MELDALLEDLRLLVEVESPSSDPQAGAACAAVAAELLESRVGGAGEIGEDGRLRWRVGDGGPARLLLLGHLDTVWPHGTLGRLPFEVRDGRITGPGVFDMKAGIVVAVHALMRLRHRGALPTVELLLSTDEEIGSLRSRQEIEDAARRCGNVLVMEPSGPGGAAKVARKGVAIGRVTVHGVAAHAGLDPWTGCNAAVILGGLLGEIQGLSDDERGTSVVPTLVTAGTTMNTVPARADAQLDMRFLDPAEPARVLQALESLSVPQPARVEVTIDVNRPPLTEAASEPLLPRLFEAGKTVGQEVATMTVGGASDGNLAAAAGAHVLDGLGPPGGGAHADHEHVLLDGLLPRVALLEELLPRVT